MNARWKSRLPLGLVAAFVLFLLIELAARQPVQAQRGAANTASPHYSVVGTEGHNLKEIGTELKLRATVDLTKVGKPAIKPTTVKSE